MAKANLQIRRDARSLVVLDERAFPTRERNGVAWAPMHASPRSHEVWKEPASDVMLIT